MKRNCPKVEETKQQLKSIVLQNEVFKVLEKRQLNEKNPWKDGPLRTF